MKRPLLGHLTPVSRLLFFILLMIACYAAVFLLSALGAYLVYDLGLRDLQTTLVDFTDPQAVPVLRYFQVTQSLGLFILPPLLAGYLFSESTSGYLGLDRSPGSLAYLFSAGIVFALLPLINWMIALNGAMHLPAGLHGIEEWMQSTEKQAAELTDAFMRMDSFGMFLQNLVMIAFLPAIGEELLFRGILQRSFAEWTGRRHLAVFLGALLFAAFHLQFYGFLPRFFLGLLLGYLFLISGSLWLPIFVHFLNNASAVVFEYLSQHGATGTGWEEAGSTDNPFIILAGTAVAACLLYMVIRQVRKERYDAA